MCQKSSEHEEMHRKHERAKTERDEEKRRGEEKNEECQMGDCVRCVYV